MVEELNAQALRCDVEEGDVLWIPEWWHETCNLDDWPVKILQSTFVDWTLCFAQPMASIFIPAYCFAVP